jgi:hypothetical protein
MPVPRHVYSLKPGNLDECGACALKCSAEKRRSDRVEKRKGGWGVGEGGGWRWEESCRGGSTLLIWRLSHAAFHRRVHSIVTSSTDERANDCIVLQPPSSSLPAPPGPSSSHTLLIWMYVWSVEGNDRVIMRTAADVIVYAPSARFHSPLFHSCILSLSLSLSHSIFLFLQQPSLALFSISFVKS